MRTRTRTATTDQDEGFTLIELLVVIIIIGILAAIAIPVFLNQRKRATETSVKSDVRTVANEIESYYTDNQAYPAITAVTGRAVVGTVTVTLSKNNQVSTTATPGNGRFCLKGENSDSSVPVWYYSNVGGGLTTSQPAAGRCS